MAASDRHRTRNRLSDHCATVLPDEGTGIASQPLLTRGDDFQALITANAEGAGAGAAMVEMTTRSGGSV